MSAKKRIIPIFVPHAGCEHACVFCNQRAISQREPEAGDLAAEIESALSRAGEGAAPELAYYGGSFTAISEEKRRRYLETARRFIDEGRISSLRVSTRPDAISEEILEELLAYGLGRIELGAQSMDDRVLVLAKRGHAAADTVRAAKCVTGRKIPLVLQMMIGLPGETPEGPAETAKRLIELQPEAVRIYPVAVLEGTELAGLWRAGKYRALTVDRAVEICAGLIELFETAGISVIRVGLQPTERLSGGGVLAGAYHPALGERARSILYLNRAREAIAKAGPADNMALFAEPRALSLLTGQKRENIKALEREFQISRLSVRGADLEPGVVLAGRR